MILEHPRKCTSFLSTYMKLHEDEDGELWQFLLQKEFPDIEIDTSLVDVIPISKKEEWYYLTQSSYWEKVLSTNKGKMRYSHLPNYDDSTCHLENTDFSYACLTAATLRNRSLDRTIFYRADLTGANISYCVSTSLNCEEAILINANLSYTKLSEAKMRFANLCNANLYHASILHTDMRGVNMSCANASLCIFDNVDLRDVTLENADISECLFTHSDLKHANLTKTIAKNTKFHYVSLYCVDFSYSNMSGAEFKGAKLEDEDDIVRV